MTISTRKILVLLLLFLCSGMTYAENIATIPCAACGNTTSERAVNTLNLLRDFNGGYAAGHGWKVGDTVTVLGGDGSKGAYKKTNQYLSITYQCVARCGPGDLYEGFVPPLASGSGGGTNYPVGGNYPGGVTIVGYTVREITGTVCSGGVCWTTTIYEYEPIWGRANDSRIEA